MAVLKSVEHNNFATDIITPYLEQVDVERLLASPISCGLLARLMESEPRKPSGGRNEKDDAPYAGTVGQRICQYFRTNNYDYQLFHKDISATYNFITVLASVLQSKSVQPVIMLLLLDMELCFSSQAHTLSRQHCCLKEFLKGWVARLED